MPEPDEEETRAADSSSLPADHWSRGRDERNREALEFLRGRSHDPGVAEGGGPRNFWCMECDGVVPHDHPGESCPHCGASLAGRTRRYFNWVEIDRPPESDLRPLLRPILLGLAGLGAFVLLVLALWLFLR